MDVSLSPQWLHLLWVLAGKVWYDMGRRVAKIEDDAHIVQQQLANHGTALTEHKGSIEVLSKGMEELKDSVKENTSMTADMRDALIRVEEQLKRRRK